MTTLVQARDSLVSHLANHLAVDYPTLPVFYENTTQVDVNTVSSPFLRVQIDFLSARQVSIEWTPQHRTLGELLFSVACKEGHGTREALTLFDYLADLVAFRTVGGVTLGTPTPGKKRPLAGWVTYELYVPFIFDSTG